MENINDLHNQQLVSTLLNSDTVTESTRKALQKRIETAKEITHFLSDELFESLSIVCERLITRILKPGDECGCFIDERLRQTL